ncbi:hypothetical protein LJY25_06020 [Hymenobacter sp. BT175]|uniref:hypothetical protein n=1 Tax=Hymenobacter translucens TaxID=2886507 RepID=UPI001D0EEBBB|nr:hypothetical protein [Hymenobacter translucens]MCC2545994.1 hypothetical protein [Hymenobacter translucens]
MKRFNLIFGLLAVAASFTACSKEDDPKTKTELITAKSWRMTAFTITTTTGSNTTTQDLYASAGACSKDNFTKFNTDKRVIFDEGTTKCSTTDPQSETGNWDFTANEAKLLLSEPGSSSAITYDLVELSESTLKLRATEVFGTTTYVDNITYASF